VFLYKGNMDLQQLYDVYLKNRIISTDSRNISRGCLFFALKGENFNGNFFALEAIEKGASLAVVDEALPQYHKQIIRVDDVLTTLQRLAGYHRIQTGIPILAITGSNGKTTTKELCKAVLSKKYKVYATEGNLNNHIGVPLTLLSMDSDTEIGIVEMGANHPGEIGFLCEIAKPDYGLITNIGKAHLEGFGGIQGVANAKGELFSFLINNEKTIFLNEGNPYLPPIVPVDYTKAVRYNGQNGLKLVNYKSSPLLNLKVLYSNEMLDIKTQLVGSYNTENVLAACCVGLHFGVAMHELASAINDYQPRNNRSQLINTGRNTVFMDAYNANPSSMLAAINEFLQFEGPKKLLILGEMREVGDSSPHEHENLVTFLQQQGISNVIFVGKAFEQAAKRAGYRHAETTDLLMELLSNEPLNGHFVFVKGSRSNRLEKIIPLL
jgi:UDP-N-acetylmuramoyl-tripeptide--D-alanyl-D-alanine ligase